MPRSAAREGQLDGFFLRIFESGGKFGPFAAQSFGVGAGFLQRRAEIGGARGQLDGFFLRIFEDCRQLADPQLQIVAHLDQGFDVAAQTFDLRQLDADRFAVGGNRLLRLGQAGFGGFGAGLLRAYQGGQLLRLIARFAKTQHQIVALGVGLLQRRRKLRHVEPQIGIALALQRQQLSEFVDLCGQALQRHVAAGQRLGQEHLRQDKDHQKEDDDDKQRRQGVDKARPDVGRGTASNTGHGSTHASSTIPSSPVWRAASPWVAGPPRPPRSHRLLWRWCERAA